MCANQEVMDAKGEVELTLKIGESLKINCRAIIVDNLSCEIILGNDAITSLEFNNKSKFIKINGKSVSLFDPNPYNTAYVAKTTFIPPYSDAVVPVKSDVRMDSSQVHVFPLRKQKPTDDLIVQDAIYSSADKLCVIVTNRTGLRQRVSKKLPLCSIKAITMETITAVKVLQNDKDDLAEVTAFQERRNLEADAKNFIPEIGSFGDVNGDQRKALEALVKENRLAFSMGQGDLGQLAYFRYTLPLHDNTKTAHQTQRPVPLSLRDKVQAEISKWSEIGIIKSSQSGFNIPLIILRKPDGSIRISLDARELNQLLVPDRFPLPHMTEVINRIGEKLSVGKECYVSSFDWFRGYWTVKVDEDDQHKLSFAYKNKHYKAARMLYGTSTAPSAFARIMQSIFGDHPSFVVYLDDLLIVDNSFEDHMESLRFLFEKCLQYGILLSAKKCNLCSTEINFLGHKISKNGVSALDKHVSAIQNYPRPTDKKSLKRFIGMANFNLKFVPNGSVIMGPLYEAVSVKRPFEWTEKQESAFNQMKEELTSAKCLRHRNTSCPLILVNDASANACGSTLLQLNGDQLETIGYSSRRFTEAEIRRPMRSKELLALTYGIKSFEYYLIGTRFQVISDHRSLLYLYKEHMRTLLDLKQTNIFHYLLNFDFEILHRPGNSDILASADALSRLPKSTFDDLEKQIQNDPIPDRVFAMTLLPEQFDEQTPKRSKIFLRALAKQKDEETDQSTSKIVVKFSDYEITRAKMRELQSECNSCKDIREKLSRSAKSASRKFQLINDLLYTIGPTARIVLPSSLANEFIEYTHVLYGHAGTFQMMKILSKHVYIFQLGDRCASITKRCGECIRYKTQKMPRPSLIQRKQFESQPFTRTFCDLYDLGKPDVKGKRYLVTFCDALTGYLDGIPVSSKSDKLVSEAIYEMILRHGIRERFITDNGLEFGPLTTAVLAKFNIIHVRTSAYMSRSNGKVERCHREITAKLKLLDANKKNWSSKWPLVKFLLNNLPKTNLDGLTAAEALYGRSLFCPLDDVEKIQTDDKAPYIKAINEYLTDLYPSLLQYQQTRHENLLRNDKGTDQEIKVGDKCLIWKPSISEGKLARSWEGPFPVIKRISKASYILRDPRTKRTFRRNCRHLRLLRREPIEPNPVDEENNESFEESELKENDEFQNTSRVFPFYNHDDTTGESELFQY